MIIRKYILAAAALAFVALKIWLSFTWPALILPYATHDDALFVKLAANILNGDWLGPYDNLTLAKGAMFPLLIAGSHAIGLPLKVAEAVICILASGLFCFSLRRLLRHDGILLLLFAALLFAPIFWTGDFSRIVREPLYTSLSLALFALTFLAFPTATLAVTPETPPGRGREAGKTGRAEYIYAALLGLCAGAYWLTREEGIWLFPALAVILLCSFLRTLRARRKAITAPATLAPTTLITAFIRAAPWRRLLVAGAGFTAVIAAVNTHNHAAYGIFRNNEFRSEEFLSAYGALNRVQPSDWRRYIVVPQENLQRIYQVSPSAGILKPYFDTDGQDWARLACNFVKHDPDCVEIPAGWFMWALRDAVASAGYYQGAPETDAFLMRMAAEINAACMDARLSCLPPRTTMMPPLRAHYIRDALERLPRLARKIVTIGKSPRPQMRISVPESPPGSARMAAMTGARFVLSPGEDHAEAPREAEEKIARNLTRLAHFYNAAIVIGALVALAGLLRYGWRWLYDPLGSVMLALAAAFGTRAFLICFLDATSIPGLNLLYFAPAYPHLVAFAVLALWMALRAPHDPKPGTEKA